jgi:hypothetical protein
VFQLWVLLQSKLSAYLKAGLPQYYALALHLITLPVVMFAQETLPEREFTLIPGMLAIGVQSAVHDI